MACADNRNPLKRGGTSQDQRLLIAMRQGYVEIDERDYADWIFFAQNFSAYLAYYDLNNKISGNWKPFFESDVSAVLGSFALQNIETYQLAIKSRLDLLKSNEQTLAAKKDTLGAIFAGVLTLCKALDERLIKLEDGHQFKVSTQNLVGTKLQPALQKLISYYKGGKKLNLIKENDSDKWMVLGMPVRKASTVLIEGLSSVWHQSAVSWDDHYANIPVDQSIYGNPSAQPIRKITNAANHNLFKGLLDQFLMFYARLINDSEAALMQSLSFSNSHTPHYALFLSFLKLFRFSKEHLNSLSQSHLDFYYRQVLRIQPKPAQADKVHLLIELARQTDACLLPRGTLFKAGKDTAGVERFYVMEEDVVFNKGKVAKLMSVYRAAAFDNNGAVDNEGRLFASPMSNSLDGLGAEIRSEFKEWHPFINKTIVDGKLASINMPAGRAGFAIASMHLCLAEGERLVTVRFLPAFTTEQIDALADTDCYLTTEKGWHKVDSPVWSTGIVGGTSNVSVLSFTLSGDIEPVTAYNSAVHGGLFDSRAPVLKVCLSNNDISKYAYDAVKDISINKVELEVRVGLDKNNSPITGGVKNLLLSNDFGVLDPSKPFFPFGPAPKKGASLIVGNQEIFQKKNTSLFFMVKWKDLPEYSYTIDHDEILADSTGYTDINPKVKAYSLEQGLWKSITGTDLRILSDFLWTDTTSSFYPEEVITFPVSDLTLPQGVISSYETIYNQFTITSINGFIKLTLIEGFGHEEYQKQLTKFLIDQAKPSPTGVPSEPDEPYTPNIEQISLHYRSSVLSDLHNKNSFQNRELQFFHIYPFGESEQHSGLTGASDMSLFPRFTSSKGIENAGEFYIGLQDIQPGQGVNILFQMLEGTSDPLIDKPDLHITWSYLSNDQWKDFDVNAVIDHTGQLVRSGIVSIVIPLNATRTNTLLEPGYVWIRAAVSEHAEAVCKALSVYAQAVLVKFQPQETNAEISSGALPAGSISKMKDAISMIKKISQPYSSFGGRPAESSDKYYVRVSERLRHRSRAITVWDYEHLILEAFPSIHKVKCLNHTEFSGPDYNEIKPGHVTIVTVPNLQNRNDANPLRPYTNQDVLEDIEIFLKKRLSCHVNIHVRHPQFEEVRLEFHLKLRRGLEFNFYSNQLKNEITRFLTPWAYGQANDVELGGKIHKSVMINFIEEQNYVDYITDVKMYHRKDESLDFESADVDTIEASTGKSILVSAPASKHKIHQVAEVAGNHRIEECQDAYNGMKNR